MEKKKHKIFSSFVKSSTILFLCFSASASFAASQQRSIPRYGILDALQKWTNSKSLRQKLRDSIEETRSCAVLSFAVDKGQLKTSISEIALDRGISDCVNLDFKKMQDSDFELPHMFLRNNALVSLDTKNWKIDTKKNEGNTEFIISWRDQLLILPVSVGKNKEYYLQKNDQPFTKEDRDINPTFEEENSKPNIGSLSLKSLLPIQYHEIDYGDDPQVLADQNSTDVIDNPTDAFLNVEEQSVQPPTHENPQTLDASVHELSQTATPIGTKHRIHKHADSSHLTGLESNKIPYIDSGRDVNFIDNRVEFSLAILDDRSSDYNSTINIYPAVGVDVEIFGTTVKLTTDINGEVAFGSFVEGTKFLIKVTDPSQLYLPTYAEISVSSQPQKLKVMSKARFDAIAEFANVTLEPDKTHLCIDLQGFRKSIETEKPKSNTPEGVATPLVEWPEFKVSLVQNSAQPVYLNSSGIPDAAPDVTSGRFPKACFFNLQSGPEVVRIQGENGKNYSQLISIGPQGFQEVSLKDKQVEQISLGLVGMPGVSEQTSGIIELDTKTISVSRATILDLDENEFLKDETELNMWAPEESNLSEATGVMPLFASSAGFETMLVEIDKRMSEEGEIKFPLLQKGFIEDLAAWDGKIADPQFGSVYVKFNPDDVNEQYHFELTNISDPHDTFWDRQIFFGSQVSQKSLFINLAGGTYVVTVKRPNGDVVGYGVAKVFQNSTSYLELTNAF